MGKVLYIAIFFLLMAFGLKSPTTDNTVVYIAAESRLKISGTTNINTFTCNFNTVEMMDPIRVRYVQTGSKYIFHKADLILDNQGFDCGNRGINRDFHGLLKSKEYPHILLRLKEIETVSTDTSYLNAVVDIEIAGRTNTYSVPVKFDQKENMCILGELKLNLDDFKLKAPKKVLGLISVHETITINFDLAVRKE
ncbi:MAG TPA: YceI family protein [Arenibacter sp.]|nr:YceI family protein [Arenibacter sp.]